MHGDRLRTVSEGLEWASPAGYSWYRSIRDPMLIDDRCRCDEEVRV